MRFLALYMRVATQRQDMGKKGRRYFEANFERNKLLGQLVEWIDALRKRQHAETSRGIL